MKQKIILIFLTLLTLCTLDSCRKRPINDGLDAQWQITHILYADGSEFVPSSPRRYICFYRHTLQLSDNGPLRITGNFVYDRENQTISIEMPLGWDNQFPAYGFDSPEDKDATPYTIKLHVENLSSNHLTYVTLYGTVITLRKF